MAASDLTAAASAVPDDDPLASDSAVLRLDGIDLITPSGQQRLAIRRDTVCGYARDDKACESRRRSTADIRIQIESRTAPRGPIGGTPVTATQ